MSELIKVPGPRNLAKLESILNEDTEFRFKGIKVSKNFTKYELLNPTEDDDTNVDLVPVFRGVIVFFKKATTFLNKEEKEAGKEAKECREVYVLREGDKVRVPERFYVSPSALKDWKRLMNELREKFGTSQCYNQVLIEFSVKHIKGTAYQWNSPVFKVLHKLNDVQVEYTTKLHDLVASRVARYAFDDVNDDAENEALGIPTKPEVDYTEKHSNAAERELTTEDDVKPAKPKSRREAYKSVEDEDAETPKPKSSSLALDDDEDEEVIEAPRATRRASITEDDDE